MSNTVKSFTGLIKNISANTLEKNGYTQIINAEVISLINPFTKEYKVKNGDSIVIAYGLTDQTYAIGSHVAVIESNADATKERYIIGATSTSTFQLYDVAMQDTHDLMGAPIIPSFFAEEKKWNVDNTLFTEYIQKAQAPCIQINVDLTLAAQASSDFFSKIIINLSNGYNKNEENYISQIIEYNIAHMSGVIKQNGETTSQFSQYFHIKDGITQIDNIIQSDVNCNASWDNLKIKIFNEVSESEATALKIIAPDGYRVYEDTTWLQLASKLRKNYTSIDNENIDFIWFRENPLIEKGHPKYDERAGAGWEKITLSN